MSECMKKTAKFTVRQAMTQISLKIKQVKLDFFHAYTVKVSKGAKIRNQYNQVQHSKTCLKRSLKIDKINVLKTNGSLIKV